MDLLQALILGIIQGLTEFLPVSSSGHIEIANYIMGMEYSDDSNMLMTVVLHAATALSTIFIFRKDIAEIFKGLLAFKWNEEFKFSIKIILSMFPAAIVGLTMEDVLKDLFTANMILVGSMLLITGGLLFLADKAKKTDKNVSLFHAIVIGVSQAIAILPGISRSGATISTSVLLGIDRSKAARFSFLMVVPLILGKMAKDIMDGALSSESVDAMPLVIGFIGAFLTGLFACKWMIALVKKSKLSYFSYYCFVVGLIAISYQFIK